MGCGQSRVEPDEKDALAQTAKIDRMLRQDKKVEARTVKILLLGTYPQCDLEHVYPGADNTGSGAGESGKSTIIKQMRIIHSGGFSVDEKQQNRAVIYSNMIVAFKVLLDIMQTEGYSFGNSKTQVMYYHWSEIRIIDWIAECPNTEIRGSHRTL